MKTRIILILLSLLIISTAWSFDIGITNEQLEKIKANEVVVSPVKSKDGILGVKAIMAVHSSREKIWETLIDYNNFKNIFDGIIDIKVHDYNEQGAYVEFYADAVLTDLQYTLYRKYVIPGHKLTWKRTAGDLKRIEGSWEIAEGYIPDKVILIYNSYVEVGYLIPTRLVRWGALRKTRSMCLKLRNWILKN